MPLFYFFLSLFITTETKPAPPLKIAVLYYASIDNNLKAELVKNIIAKFDNNNGTLGKLMNDPTLYKNLASSGNKLNLLLDDIRVNPKRYISISVFGKKQNNNPLLVPMPDTLNSPYYVEKAN